MPSFDIVSEVDKQEIDNAINQSVKELVWAPKAGQVWELVLR